MPACHVLSRYAEPSQRLNSEPAGVLAERRGLGEGHDLRRARSGLGSGNAGPGERRRESWEEPADHSIAVHVRLPTRDRGGAIGGRQRADSRRSGRGRPGYPRSDRLLAEILRHRPSASRVGPHSQEGAPMSTPVLACGVPARATAMPAIVALAILVLGLWQARPRAPAARSASASPTRARRCSPRRTSSALHVKRTRYFVAADVMQDAVERAKARAFVKAARARRRLDAAAHLDERPAPQARQARLHDAATAATSRGSSPTSASSACKRLRRLERGQPQDRGDLEPRRQRGLVLQEHVPRGQAALLVVRRRRARRPRPDRGRPLHRQLLRRLSARRGASA